MGTLFCVDFHRMLTAHKPYCQECPTSYQSALQNSNAAYLTANRATISVALHANCCQLSHIIADLQLCEGPLVRHSSVAVLNAVLGVDSAGTQTPETPSTLACEI